MAAYLVLVLAAFSRLFPHLLHGVGLNITAVGGGLLFFGARRPAREIWVAASIMALTDVYLTAVVFRVPFHLQSYLVTWLWYAAVPLLGAALLRHRTASTSHRSHPRANLLIMWCRTRLSMPVFLGKTGASAAAFPLHLQGNRSIARAAAAVCLSATSFFLLSNFVFWAESNLYPRTAAGLISCYLAAVPFYANDLVSTGLTLGVLLGLPSLARQLHRALASADRFT